MTEQVARFVLCPKVVVRDEATGSVLLCRRTGEADLDGRWSFPGGKIDSADRSVEAGVARELCEELGPSVAISVAFAPSIDVAFTKRNGDVLWMPHLYGSFEGGAIELAASEYSDARWFNLDAIASLEDAIENVAHIARQLARLRDAGHIDPINRFVGGGRQ